MAKVKMTQQDVIKLNSVLLKIETEGKNISGEVWSSMSTIKYKIEPNYKAIIEGRDKVLEKYVEKDGKGWKVDDNGIDFVFKSDTAKKKYEEEMTPLLEKKIEVSIELIEKAKLNKATFEGIKDIMLFFNYCVK